MCRVLSEHKQSKELLRMILGGTDLFVNSTGECLEYPTFTHRLSLADLLDKGYFKSAYEGGLFTPRSKRTLVLNLARCLLCLFGGKWLQRKWEALDLVFLCTTDGQTECLVDMHRPYVSGSLSHSVPPVKVVRDASSVPHHPAVLSFARLLVDIERGRRITDEEYELSDGQRNEWLTISSILSTKLSGSLTGHYTTAVQSCLDFARAGRRDVNETDTDYIYQNIVIPLQKELSDYPTSHLENVALRLPPTLPKDTLSDSQLSSGVPLPHRPRPPPGMSNPTPHAQRLAPGVAFFDDANDGGKDDAASQ